MTLVRAPAFVRPRAHTGRAPADAITALRETVQSIWHTVGQSDPERALLYRRELVQQGTCRLSAVIRWGVETGAFRPECPSWAIERLPFAIVAGAFAHWVLGLSTGPSLRASTAIGAALEILQPAMRRPYRSARHERSEP